jgi:hypothetical protein
LVTFKFDIEDWELEDRRVRFLATSASAGAAAAASWTRSFLVYNLAPRAAGFVSGDAADLAAFLAREGLLALAGLLDLARAGDLSDFLAAALRASFDLERAFLAAIPTGSDADTSVAEVLSASLDASLDDLCDIFILF